MPGQAASYWLNFIRTGDPNGADYNGSPLPEWSACSVEGETVMRFTDRPQPERCADDPALDVRIRYACDALKD